MLIRAKASRNLTVMKFDHGFAEKLPDADGSFARVVSALFFHHLRPELKASALRDAYRFLVLGVKSTSLIGSTHGAIHAAALSHYPLLDGLANTADHSAGRLPSLVSAAKFQRVLITEQIATPCGTMELIPAVKPTEIAPA